MITNYTVKTTNIDGRQSIDVDKILHKEPIRVTTFVTNMQPYGAGVLDGIIGLSPCP